MKTKVSFYKEKCDYVFHVSSAIKRKYYYRNEMIFDEYLKLNPDTFNPNFTYDIDRFSRKVGVSSIAKKFGISTTRVREIIDRKISSVGFKFRYRDWVKDND